MASDRYILRTGLHQIVPLLFTTPGHGFHLFIVGETKTSCSPGFLSPSFERGSILAFRDSRWVLTRGMAFIFRAIHNGEPWELWTKFFTTFFSRSCGRGRTVHTTLSESITSKFTSSDRVASSLLHRSSRSSLIEQKHSIILDCELISTESPSISSCSNG